MNNLKHYIVFILLLTLSTSGLAQKKSKKSRANPRQNIEMLLSDAKSIQAKSPTKAIKLVEEAITYSRKRKDRQLEAEAYLVLGDIYVQIDQKELALERFQTTIRLVGKSKNSALKAQAYQRIGQLYIDQSKPKEAQRNFTECLMWSQDKSLTLICEEGLADVQLMLNNVQGVDSQLENINKNYTLDSAALSRNLARQAQNYVQQKDFERANQSYQSSLNTIPAGDTLNAAKVLPKIKKVQEELLEQEISLAEKIEISSNTAGSNLFKSSNDEQVKQNLEIAELYEADNDFDNAEAIVAVSKKLIKPDTDAGVAAEVYKKSSEYNRRKGAIELALLDIAEYSKAREEAIQQLENDLKEQIEIVKGQQKIDLLQRDFDLEEKDRALMESQLKTQKIIIGLLSLIIVAALAFFYFLYKNVKAKRQANQLLLLKSLRTQMNPHFIFNALNSVNNFIAKNDEKSANKFLASFSRLMRKVLDYSQKDFITFEEEMELNELYLQLEHFRFRDRFDYTFENKAQYGYGLEVPPMLIQPFIENAVWHGLRYKEEKGQLDIQVNQEGSDLTIIIKDDGIGRTKSKALKTSNQKKYKSTGLENVSKRIALINKIYGKNYKIEVQDLNKNIEDSGTLVTIKIPVEPN